jgi:5-enolpyruvylshikimate-3-phosphate synthase
LRINDPQVVSKSYPNYWTEFEKLLGADMQIF